MKIVSYNIQFGLGKDDRIDLERIAAEVAGADIIALQEVDRHWPRSDNADQVAQLESLLDQYYWVYGPYFDVNASTAQPDGRIKNVRRQFGNLILSKTPILSTRLFILPKSDLGVIYNTVVGVLEAVVELQNGDGLRIYNTHLCAVSARDRALQIIAMRDFIRRAPAEGGALTDAHANPYWREDTAAPPMPEDFVLLGDFNLEAKDSEYDHLTGHRDEHSNRISSPGDYVDTWVATGRGEGDGVTYPEQPYSSEIQGRRIDYAFVAESMRHRVLGARIDNSAEGSDHQPYWIDLE